MSYSNEDKILNILIEKLKTNKCLDEEVEYDNIEYKLRLDKMDNAQIKKLESQMLWRINEGKLLHNICKAYYVIGIQDNGKLGNINLDIINESINKLKKICDNANLVIDYIFKYKYNEDKIIAISIIKKAINKHIPELSIFLYGNNNTEKTTFLGNLCYDTIDDSNGKSKLLILKHKHEIYSGKTSSIHHEIIGLNKESNTIINYRNSSLDFNNSWDKIFNKSDIIINLFDSPGDIKFQKTTMNSLLNINPDIIFLFTNYTDIITSNDILDKIKLCIDLDKVFYLIITKEINNDYTNEYIMDILEKKLLDNDLIYNLIEANYNNTEIKSNNIKYLFLDNRNNETFNKFKNTLNNIILENSIVYPKTPKRENMCFHIYEVFDIPIFNKNIIISGKVISGNIEINQIYNLNHTKIKVINIHNKSIDCDVLYKGESGCLEIEFVEDKININKFMTITDNIQNLIIPEKIYVRIKSNITQEDNILIYSKYFSGNFNLKNSDKEVFELINNNSNKIIINNDSFVSNNKCIIKYKDNLLVGEIFF